MRTDPPHTDHSTLARLRSRAGRARRWLDGPNRAARWAAALGIPALAVAAATYLSSPGGNGEAVSWEPLYGSHKLSASEIERVSAALYGGKIVYDLDSHGRIVVPASRKLEARVLLVNKKAAPRTLDDVRDEMGRAASIWEGLDQREALQHRLREETLELEIRDLPGIESAHVIIGRPSPRGGQTRADRATAVVHLRPEDGVPLAHSRIEAIRSLVISQEPQLRDALTIQDVDGHTYLMAGEPDVGARSRALAQQEEWTGQIFDRLKGIDGLRVFVKLDAPTTPDPAAAIEPAIGINAALGPAIPAKATPSGKAMVLVQVPIRYYRDRYHELERADHEPSPADLMPYTEKVEQRVIEAVRNVIPTAELGDIKVTRIDVPGPPRAPATGPVAELRRLPPWWPVAAVATGFAAMTLIGLIGRWLSNRRPAASRADRPRGRLGYGADSPGPSERVRDLVRRDPEAAAGVLHRWIGAGESDS